MTPKQLLDATWIPHPVPGGDREEVLGPWTGRDSGRERILVLVRIEGELFVLSSLPGSDKPAECWKVLP